MKLTGKLKENVEKAENKEQAKELIADAGMELTDEEMDQVSGGGGIGWKEIDETDGWEEVSPGLYTDGYGRYVSR